MSALRKLRALREKEAIAKEAQSQAAEEVEKDEDSGALSTTKKPVVNPFNLLAEDEEENDNKNNYNASELSSVAPCAEKQLNATVALESGSSGSISASSSRNNNASSKPKKKKTPSKVKDGRGKGVITENDENFDELLQEFKVSGQEEDEEPRESEHVNMHFSGGSNNVSINRLFITEAKAFDMELEVKKRFGSMVIREMNKKKRSGNKFSHLKKTVLVRPSEDWPAFTERSFDMLSLGKNCFQLLPTDRAHMLDREYEQWAATHDPQAIVSFSARYPYHQQCLLTLSHLLESQGDFATAHKFVQMCVYSLEQCFASDFKVFEGSSRVSCELEAHQVLFAALYRHSQLLGKTGCPRTALEVAKFLLSLSPDRDPQCVLFALDYLAIRSQEYSYLLSFVSTFDPATFSPSLRTPFPGPIHSSLHYPPACLLPNMVYSCAFAKFCLEGKKNVVDKNNLNPGWFQQDLSKKTASQLLQCAILLFPEVIPELLEKVSDRELEKGVWKHLLISLEGLQSVHPYVNKLATIFAERSASLWSDDDVLQWVQENTAEALSKWPMVKTALREMRQWFFSPKRPVPNHIRMLAKNHYSDEVPSVPDELRVAAERAELKHDQPAPQQGALAAAARQQALPLDANPLAVMLMSLLPWYGIQPGGGRQPEPDEDEEED